MIVAKNKSKVLESQWKQENSPSLYCLDEVKCGAELKERFISAIPCFIREFRKTQCIWKNTSTILLVCGISTMEPEMQEVAREKLRR
jgi:hypothetical protein